jgi:hypothetical protein
MADSSATLTARVSQSVALRSCRRPLKKALIIKNPTIAHYTGSGQKQKLTLQLTGAYRMDYFKQH